MTEFLKLQPSYYNVGQGEIPRAQMAQSDDWKVLMEVKMQPLPCLSPKREIRGAESGENCYTVWYEVRECEITDT